ncbi:MAG: alpha/beta hydrolase [Candidatus Nanopelagicales bacterium]
MSSLLDTARGPVQLLDEGAGDPVLVVHGSPGGCDQGRLMAQFLIEAGFRAIIPSRPGYLDTPLTDENAAIDAQADLFAAALDALGIDTTAVLCWSGGGPSSYRLAVRHAHRVRAVAALAAVSHDYHWQMGVDEKFMFGTRAGNRLIALMARHKPEQLVAATLKAEGDLTKDELDNLTAHVFADPVKREFVLGLAATVSHRGNRRAGMENDRDTFAEIGDLQLSAIEAPVLLVQGDSDTDVPPEYSQYAAERLPNVELIEVPLGTHLAAFTADDSDAVQQRIVSFLRSGVLAS